MTALPATANQPNPAITAATTPLDVVNAAFANPDVQSVITAYFGNSAHGPVGSVIGTVLAAVLVHFGISQPSPTEWTLICGFGSISGGYVWQSICNRWLRPATPQGQKQ